MTRGDSSSAIPPHSRSRLAPVHCSRSKGPTPPTRSSLERTTLQSEERDTATCAAGRASFSSASSTPLRPARRATSSLSASPSPSQPATPVHSYSGRAPPAHPALLNAHTHRAYHLDLLDSLDDDTLAALANELREIGLAKVSQRPPPSPRDEHERDKHDVPAARAAQRGALGVGRTSGTRRATTPASTGLAERNRFVQNRMLPTAATSKEEVPPPAYHPVDPLRRSQTGRRNSAPLAVVHERRISASSRDGFAP